MIPRPPGNAQEGLAPSVPESRLRPAIPADFRRIARKEDLAIGTDETCRVNCFAVHNSLEPPLCGGSILFRERAVRRARQVPAKIRALGVQRHFLAQGRYPRLDHFRPGGGHGTEM